MRYLLSYMTDEEETWDDDGDVVLPINAKNVTEKHMKKKKKGKGRNLMENKNYKETYLQKETRRVREFRNHRIYWAAREAEGNGE